MRRVLLLNVTYEPLTTVGLRRAVCLVLGGKAEVVHDDVAGAVLHDVCKVYELSYGRGFGYTTEGQLLGHMVMGLRIVSDKLRDLPGFPPQLRTLVEHMIVSHHGKYEFGSPKLPQFAEALLLHYLDDMDSKMECMRALVEHDRQVDGHFTGFNAALERTVLKKAKYLSTAPCVEEKAAPATATPPPETAVKPPPVSQAVPKEASHPLFAAPDRVA